MTANFPFGARSNTLGSAWNGPKGELLTAVTVAVSESILYDAIEDPTMPAWSWEFNTYTNFPAGSTTTSAGKAEWVLSGEPAMGVSTPFAVST